MLHSTKVSPMIGKSIFPRNTSQLKVNLNSKLSSLFLRELLSISLNKRRRRIILNSMSEEFSLWMIAKNLSLNGLASLRE
jgi:hypothetical protein